MVSRRDKINQRSSQDRAVSPERVRKVQAEENKRFREVCLDHGCEPEDIWEPQKESNNHLFGGKDKVPSGTPGKWSDENKQKQSIAKKRSSDAIVEKDVQGKDSLITVSIEEAEKAKQEIERDGVDKLWDFLFGTRHVEEAKEVEQLDLFEQSINTEESSNESDGGKDGKDDKDDFKFFIFF
jgi:hypothetical protein